MDHPHFTQDNDNLEPEAEDDWYFDNGSVHAIVTIEGNCLRMHDFGANDASLQGGRSGIGRAAMAELRQLFPKIIVDGAIHPYGGFSTDEKPLLFWQAMLEEGLIDVMILGGCGTEITRNDLGGEVETSFGRISLPYQPVASPLPK